MTTRINDQSLTGIETPAENDVPLGRGGYINSHPGHRRYISIVQEKKLEYVTCKKHNKTKIAWSIVHELRALNPPARFLQKDPSTGLWNDVGDKRMREKISQALREHQPFIRAVIESEQDPSTEAQPAMRRFEVERMDSLADMDFDFEPSNDASSVSLAEPDIPTAFIETDKRRKLFLDTRVEGRPGLSTADELDDNIDHNISLDDFSVSQGPSFSSLPSFAFCGHRSSHCEKNVIEDAFKIGLDYLDFPSENESNLCIHNNDELGFEKIGWEETSLAQIASIPAIHRRRGAAKRAFSNGEMSSSIKRYALGGNKSPVATRVQEISDTESSPDSFPFPRTFSDDQDEMETFFSVLKQRNSFP